MLAYLYHAATDHLIRCLLSSADYAALDNARDEVLVKRLALYRLRCPAGLFPFLCLSPRHWHLHCEDEAGCLVVQCGPVGFELIYSDR